MCGEYGEARGRPHYHACLLNIRFKDQLFYSSRGGNNIYTSALLDSIWQLGECKIGALTMESAAYVARYCTQTITGKAADKAYRLYDSTTGETWLRKPEYAKMSNRPGIGAPWLHKYVSDIYPKGEHYVGGHYRKPPRYYDNLFRKHYDNNDVIYEQISKRREARAILQQPDNTKDRRAVKEELANIRFKQLKRSLK